MKTTRKFRRKTRKSRRKYKKRGGMSLKDLYRKGHIAVTGDKSTGHKADEKKAALIQKRTELMEDLKNNYFIVDGKFLYYNADKAKDIVFYYKNYNDEIEELGTLKDTDSRRDDSVLIYNLIFSKYGKITSWTENLWSEKPPSPPESYYIKGDNEKNAKFYQLYQNYKVIESMKKKNMLRDAVPSDSEDLYVMDENMNLVLKNRDDNTEQKVYKLTEPTENKGGKKSRKSRRKRKMKGGSLIGTDLLTGINTTDTNSALAFGTTGGTNYMLDTITAKEVNTGDYMSPDLKPVPMV